MLVIRNEKARSALKIVVPIALTVLVFASALLTRSARSYLLVSIAVSMLSVIFFMTGYEKKKTGTRRLIIAAALIALSVISRFIPFFKPVTALTIISGVYLGPETGFLVGSMSAVISDFYFGLGPWTPFQMLAWGLIGLAAGLLAGILKKNMPLMVIFSALSGVAFSMIMDTWTVIWMNESFSIAAYVAVLTPSLPFMLLYVASNVIFILVLAKPIGKKLERMRIKYGV